MLVLFASPLHYGGYGKGREWLQHPQYAFYIMHLGESQSASLSVFPSSFDVKLTFHSTPHSLYAVHG